MVESESKCRDCLQPIKTVKGGKWVHVDPKLDRKHDAKRPNIGKK